MAYSRNFFGKTSRVPSRATSTGYQNGTLAGFVLATPVSTNTSGQAVITDVSNETSVMRFIGITTEAIPSGASGQVCSGGRAEALGAELSSFSFGDPVYLGKNGTLINSKPDIGVAGFLALDWVVFVGVVVKNEFDPGQKDIQMMVEVIGQL